MLEAYFDDGGSHQVPAISVLAGYVGTPAEWEVFGAEWNDFLRREGLPFYHAVDSAHAVRHFAGRSKSECNRLHHEAINLINNRRLIAVGVAVGLEGFNRVYSSLAELYETANPNVKLEARPKMEFYQNLGFALQYLSFYAASQNPGEAISITFEESPQVMGEAPRLFAHWMERIQPELRPYFVGEPDFRAKSGNHALQAADILAYEMGLDLKRHLAGNRKHPTRKSWQALWEHAASVTPGKPMFYCQPWNSPEADGFSDLRSMVPV